MANLPGREFGLAPFNRCVRYFLCHGSRRTQAALGLASSRLTRSPTSPLPELARLKPDDALRSAFFLLTGFGRGRPPAQGVFFGVSPEFKTSLSLHSGRPFLLGHGECGLLKRCNSPHNLRTLTESERPGCEKRQNLSQPTESRLGSFEKLRDTLQWNPEPGRPVVEFISQLIYSLGDDVGIQ